MDGTLLNDRMEVSDNNANAIKLAQASGIEFLVATGRGINEAKPFFDYANIKSGLITLNGAEIYNTDAKIVAAHYINKDLAVDITNTLTKENIYYELITNKGIFSNSYDNRVANVADLMVVLNPGLDYQDALNLSADKLKLMTTNYVDSYDQLLADKDVKILKIISFSSNGRQYLNTVVEQYSNLDDIVVTSSSENNIEINDAHAQKGLALMDYAEQMGYAKDEVMAIGDNLNDYSMIKMAGYGVAMGNAVDDIKNIANMQTDTNINDGVAKIIQKAINGLD